MRIYFSSTVISLPPHLLINYCLILSHSSNLYDYIYLCWCLFLQYVYKCITNYTKYYLLFTKLQWIKWNITRIKIYEVSILIIYVTKKNWQLLYSVIFKFKLQVPLSHTGPKTALMSFTRQIFQSLAINLRLLPGHLQKSHRLWCPKNLNFTDST